MPGTMDALRFQLLPPEPDDAMWGAPCEQPLERRYQALPALVCIMCCLFGVVYCFFGYRCFKAVLFLTGLLFGSVIIFLLCYRERVLETQLSAGASAGIALGIGLLCGLVAMLVRSVGLFLVGLLLGLLLAAAALLGSAPYYQPGSVWGPLGLLLGGGLLCALLTLRWPRLLTTLATAVTGAALIATAADYFAELLLLGRYVVERLRAAPVPPLCWRSWALLALWPLLSLMGVLVQWRVTTERDSHTEVVISRQRRRVQLMRIRQQEERKEKRRKKRPPRAPPKGPRAPPRPGPPDPAYRRRPVPIKRFNGDVLSPSYIQSFRDRQTGSSLSSFMASPTDTDYEVSPGPVDLPSHGWSLTGHSPACLCGGGLPAFPTALPSNHSFKASRLYPWGQMTALLPLVSCPLQSHQPEGSGRGWGGVDALGWVGEEGGGRRAYMHGACLVSVMPP